MSSLSAKKREFQDLLAKNEPLQTVDALKDFVIEDCEKYKELLFIEGQLREVRRKEHQNIDHPSDLQREKNRIRRGLIDFIYNLQEADYPLIDLRDGKKYRKVELDGRVWMAENLNFDIGEGCLFYDNDSKNGERYGRLYTWEAARNACPPGWRLPADEEWKKLASSFGGYLNRKKIGDPHSAFAALIEGGKSKFDALLGGHYYSHDSFGFLDLTGSFWSSTEFYNKAFYFFFDPRDRTVGKHTRLKSFGLSCRCIRS